MILASASRIRSQILARSGVKHRCISSNLDEEKIKKNFGKKDSSAETVAIILSEAKAMAVAKELVFLGKTKHFIINADQILECEGRWFNKPLNKSTARETLLALRGKTHHVISAVTVFHGKECLWRYCETPALEMRNFSDSFLEGYLKSSMPEIFESVGAYRLEDSGLQLFSRIDGDYFTILGLPLLALLGFLREQNILAK